MEVSKDSANNELETNSTMGNILSTSADNKPEKPEEDTSVSPEKINESEVIGTSNVSANESNKPISVDPIIKKKEGGTSKGKEDDVERYTKNLSVQDINLIIMGKPDSATDSPSYSGEENLSDELWMASSQELSKVKVDNEDDFEDIVKSLETAIVATDNYDNDSPLPEQKSDITSSTLSENNKVSEAVITETVDIDNKKSDSNSENLDDVDACAKVVSDSKRYVEFRESVEPSVDNITVVQEKESNFDISKINILTDKQNETNSNININESNEMTVSSNVIGISVDLKNEELISEGVSEEIFTVTSENVTAKTEIDELASESLSQTLDEVVSSVSKNIGASCDEDIEKQDSLSGENKVVSSDKLSEKTEQFKDETPEKIEIVKETGEFGIIEKTVETKTVSEADKKIIESESTKEIVNSEASDKVETKITENDSDISSKINISESVNTEQESSKKITVFEKSKINIEAVTGEVVIEKNIIASQVLIEKDKVLLETDLKVSESEINNEQNKVSETVMHVEIATELFGGKIEQICTENIETCSKSAEANENIILTESVDIKTKESIDMPEEVQDIEEISKMESSVTEPDTTPGKIVTKEEILSEVVDKNSIETVDDQIKTTEEEIGILDEPMDEIKLSRTKEAEVIKEHKIVQITEEIKEMRELESTTTSEEIIQERIEAPEEEAQEYDRKSEEISEVENKSLKEESDGKNEVEVASKSNNDEELTEKKIDSGNKTCKTESKLENIEGNPKTTDEEAAERSEILRDEVETNTEEITEKISDIIDEAACEENTSSIQEINKTSDDADEIKYEILEMVNEEKSETIESATTGQEGTKIAENVDDTVEKIVEEIDDRIAATDETIVKDSEEQKVSKTVEKVDDTVEKAADNLLEEMDDRKIETDETIIKDSDTQEDNKSVEKVDDTVEKATDKLLEKIGDSKIETDETGVEDSKAMEDNKITDETLEIENKTSQQMTERKPKVVDQSTSQTIKEVENKMENIKPMELQVNTVEIENKTSEASDSYIEIEEEPTSKYEVTKLKDSKIIEESIETSHETPEKICESKTELPERLIDADNKTKTEIECDIAKVVGVNKTADKINEGKIETTSDSSVAEAPVEIIETDVKASGKTVQEDKTIDQPVIIETKIVVEDVATAVIEETPETEIISEETETTELSDRPEINEGTNKTVTEIEAATAEEIVEEKIAEPDSSEIIEKKVLDETPETITDIIEEEPVEEIATAATSKIEENVEEEEAGTIVEKVLSEVEKIKDGKQVISETMQIIAENIEQSEQNESVSEEIIHIPAVHTGTEPENIVEAVPATQEKIEAPHEAEKKTEINKETVSIEEIEKDDEITKTIDKKSEAVEKNVDPVEIRIRDEEKSTEIVQEKSEDSKKSETLEVEKRVDYVEKQIKEITTDEASNVETGQNVIENVAIKESIDEETIVVDKAVEPSEEGLNPRSNEAISIEIRKEGPENIEMIDSSNEKPSDVDVADILIEKVEAAVTEEVIDINPEIMHSKEADEQSDSSAKAPEVNEETNKETESLIAEVATSEKYSKESDNVEISVEKPVEVETCKKAIKETATFDSEAQINEESENIKSIDSLNVKVVTGEEVGQKVGTTAIEEPVDINTSIKGTTEALKESEAFRKEQLIEETTDLTRTESSNEKIVEVEKVLKQIEKVDTVEDEESVKTEAEVKDATERSEIELTEIEKTADIKEPETLNIETTETDIKLTEKVEIIEKPIEETSGEDFTKIIKESESTVIEETKKIPEDVESISTISEEGLENQSKGLTDDVQKLTEYSEEQLTSSELSNDKNLLKSDEVRENIVTQEVTVATEKLNKKEDEIQGIQKSEKGAKTLPEESKLDEELIKGEEVTESKIEIAKSVTKMQEKIEEVPTKAELISLPRKHPLPAQSTSVSPPKKIKLIRDKPKILRSRPSTAISKTIEPKTPLEQKITTTPKTETVEAKVTTEKKIIAAPEIIEPVCTKETTYQTTKEAIIEPKEEKEIPLVTELEGKSKQKLKLTRNYRIPKSIAKKQVSKPKEVTKQPLPSSKMEATAEKVKTEEVLKSVDIEVTTDVHPAEVVKEKEDTATKLAVAKQENEEIESRKDVVEVSPQIAVEPEEKLEDIEKGKLVSEKTKEIVESQDILSAQNVLKEEESSPVIPAIVEKQAELHEVTDVSLEKNPSKEIALEKLEEIQEIVQVQKTEAIQEVVQTQEEPALKVEEKSKETSLPLQKGGKLERKLQKASQETKKIVASQKSVSKTVEKAHKAAQETEKRTHKERVKPEEKMQTRSASQKMKAPEEIISTIPTTLKEDPSKIDDVISCDSPQFDQSSSESTLKIVAVQTITDDESSLSPVTVTKPLKIDVDLDESKLKKLEEKNIPKITITKQRSSPKIRIKPIIKPPDEPTPSKSSDNVPRVIIKPVVKPVDPLKITITKQSHDTHSILKIYKPEEESVPETVPKFTIRPIPKSEEAQHSPRRVPKSIRQSLSPNITVKPVVASDTDVKDPHSSKVRKIQTSEENYPKVTIKPVLRPEETQSSPLSPRQTLKIKTMAFESSGITMEPVLSSPPHQQESQVSPLKISVKPFAKIDEPLSPKLSIKPIAKTCEIVHSEDGSASPLKLTIKPILKPEESFQSHQSPKITIKPVLKPEETGEDPEKPERIVLKIPKTNLPSPKERPSKEAKKESEIRIDPVQETEKGEKLGKIKLKLMKEAGHAQIIPSTMAFESTSQLKRTLLSVGESRVLEKRPRTELGPEILHTSDISINLVEPNAKTYPQTVSEEVTIMKIDKSVPSTSSVLSKALTAPLQSAESKFKDMLLQIQQKPEITCTQISVEHQQDSSDSDDVKFIGVIKPDDLKDPLSFRINEESNSQDVVIVGGGMNPLQDIQITRTESITEVLTPRKRGRPRKNPLEVKPEIKGEDGIEISEVRPKRTCRAPPGRTPFMPKERKPRGGRGSRGARGRGAARGGAVSMDASQSPQVKMFVLYCMQ